jgi:hypothetical protein
MFSLFRNIREIRDDLREIVITFRFISGMLANTDLTSGFRPSLNELNETSKPQENKVKSMADFYLENNPDKIVEEEKNERVEKTGFVVDSDFFGYNGDIRNYNPNTLIDVNEAMERELEEQKNA